MVFGLSPYTWSYYFLPSDGVRRPSLFIYETPVMILSLSHQLYSKLYHSRTISALLDI